MTMHRFLRPLPLALLAILALTPGIISRAETTSPGQEALVQNPCGPIPADWACLLASFTAPRDGTILTASGDFELTFNGVAPRDSEVFLYFLREDGTLVSTTAQKTRASDDGRFSMKMSFLSFGAGTFRAAAYARTPNQNASNDTSFLQLTGVPTPTFMVNGSAEPPEGCTHSAEMQRFELPAELGAGRGYLIKAKEGYARTFYWVREKNGAEVPEEQAVRDYIHGKSIKELVKVSCAAARKQGLNTSDVTGMAASIRATVKSEGLESMQSYGTDSFFLTFNEIMNRVLQQLKDSNGCTEADFEPRDLEWAPWSGGRSSAAEGNGVIGWTFFKRRPQEARECEVDGRTFTVQWISGESPMLFFRADHPVDATVRVGVPTGELTFARPAQQGGAWQVHAGPSVNTAPLYYEFDAPMPTLPDAAWVVAGAQLESFLREQLLAAGYDASDIDAFLRTDLHPRLPEAPFFEVRIFPRATVDQLLPLTITPTPDRIDRVLFHLTPVASATTLYAAPAIPHAGEGSFTVAELGALIAKP